MPTGGNALRYGLRRLPFDALERYVQWRLKAESDAQVAEACGVTRRTVVRWRKVGLTIESADVAATNLGVHPSWIWGEAWWKEETHDNADGDRSASASPSLRGA